MINNTQLRTTPELEDSGQKYTEEGRGKIDGKLLGGYFRVVQNLPAESGKLNKTKVKAVEPGCGEGYSVRRSHRTLPQNAEFMASEYVKKLVPRAQKLSYKVSIIQESTYATEYLNYWPTRSLEKFVGGRLSRGLTKEPFVADACYYKKAEYATD